MSVEDAYKSESTEDVERAVYELLRMAQTDTISAAVKSWEAERQGMRELHDENAALKIYIRRFRVIVSLMKQYLDVMESEGSLFLSPKAKAQGELLRKQLAENEKVLERVRVLVGV